MSEYVIPEVLEPLHRLGRHVRHDPRSRAYAFSTAGLTLVNAKHTRHAPVFDQGELGMCTGAAAVGALGTDPHFPLLEGKVDFTVDTARSVYSEATALDDFDGTYPPDDTGSDGLSVAKACQKHGWISAYTHTFSANDALLALTVRPLIVGMNWYSSFDTPTSSGLVSIGSRAYVRGGHEVCFDEIDADNGLVWFTNSWGAGWGKGGRACLTFATFTRLLREDGDATVFVPVTEPAPTPTPSTPTTDEADEALYAAVTRSGWLTAKHVGTNKQAATAVSAWATSKGFH